MMKQISLFAASLGALAVYTLYRRRKAADVTPEAMLRKDLAAAHTLSAHFGFDE